MRITIIGFGEAGPVFADSLVSAGHQLTAWDRQQDPDFTGNPQASARQIEKTRRHNVVPAENAASSVADAELVISTVTASQALAAARACLPGLTAGTHWLDLNSISPNSKADVAKLVATRDCRFTEAVAMDTVPSYGAGVPLLFCGPDAEQLSETLILCGWNIKVLGRNLGVAATTKLLRSVLIKGLETLFSESMEAAGRAGVYAAVLDSLDASYPGMDWQTVAGYMLSRSARHAQRRAAEMREAAVVVESQQVEPILSIAIAQKLQQLAERNIADRYLTEESTVEAFIRATSRD